MSNEMKLDEVIAVKGKGKWRSKWVCKGCKGTTFKTVVKGKEFMCRNCGKTNTGVLFVWDSKKKGLIMWVPPPPEAKPTVAELEKILAAPDQPIVTLPNGEIRVMDQVPSDRVEPKDGVEPPVMPDPAGTAADPAQTSEARIDSVTAVQSEVIP